MTANHFKDPSCLKCIHLRIVHDNFGLRNMRCFKARHMRRTPAIAEPHFDVGSDCSMERDILPEPQRVDGDKCGPAGKHWEATQ